MQKTARQQYADDTEWKKLGVILYGGTPESRRECESLLIDATKEFLGQEEYEAFL